MDTVAYLSPTNILCGWCNHTYQQHVDGYAWLEDQVTLEEVVCDREPLNILLADHNAPVTFSNGDQFPIAHGDFDYYADTFMTLKDADLSNKYLTEANPFAFVEDEYDSNAAELSASSRYVDYIEYATEYDPYARNDYLWAAARYSDKHPHEFTSAITAWKRTLNADPFVNTMNDYTPTVYIYPTDSLQAVGQLPNAMTVTEGQTRNAYWLGEEGVNAGHLVVKVYDEHLTQLFHQRLLNVYNDKRTGALRCGGLELTKDSEFAYAKCVNSKCGATLKCAIDDDFENQESFVLDVIRHGNNHAAAWFTNRDTFYKVHTDKCQLDCDPKAAHCIPAISQEKVA